ncbi:DNA repair protein RecN [Pectinatus haikarae]|uniref:DNA repair protein RecN n=1 Tax=Pectinatus haikarae TaxID=349096 RepID=A0ABT9Y7C0_9FIRM|nr:DNA repair protein RecN [Pectinatus haikarae]MDQ0203415.1 DNA repair protein RecN (Recombination protein N) [Pectinatus haikarae]
MLKTLTVWNLALIDHLQVNFDDGLNILTGETGAGKSLLLGALGLLMGQRSNIDVIRNGGSYLRIEAVCTIDNDDVHSFLENNAILDEANELIIVRQINRNGRNIIQINGCQVTAAALKALSELMIDIHGQNENQSLLRPEEQLALVDRAVPDFEKYMETYIKAYGQYREITKKLNEKKAASQNYTEHMEMLRWQNDEIEAIAIQPDEDREIEEKIKKITNTEKIANLVKSTYSLLADDNNGETVLIALSGIKKNLDALLKYDKNFATAKKIADDAYIQLQEISYEVRDYIDDIDYDPTVLNMLLRRSDDIERLCRKYGPEVDNVLAYQKKIKDELDEMENYDVIIKDMQSDADLAEKELEKAAAELKAVRKKAADELSKRVKEQLLDLGMHNAQFAIQFKDTQEYSKTGTETAQILFCANVGEECKPLQRTASGGELSRIALAIKTVTAADDHVGVMVFDEIDAGIGGKTAQMVAERIAKIAAFKQVLCITHLPQIACMADAHFYIDKTVQKEHTVTRIKKLSSGEQLNEIARMASGIDITAASLDNAMEMLNNARLKKKRMEK